MEKKISERGNVIVCMYCIYVQLNKSPVLLCSFQLRDITIPGGGDLVLGQEYTDIDKGRPRTN